MGWGHHGWIMGGLGGWDVLIGLVVMALFWGGLIALLFFVVRAAVGGGRGSRDGDPKKDALSILAQRYAKGEISTDEYQEMKATLRG